MAFMTALGMMTRVLVKQFLEAARLLDKLQSNQYGEKARDVCCVQHVWHQKHGRFEPAIELVVRSSL